MWYVVCMVLRAMKGGKNYSCVYTYAAILPVADVRAIAGVVLGCVGWGSRAIFTYTAAI